jgi:hypothetical protein
MFKESLVSILIQVKAWIVPEQDQNRSEWQRKIKRLINRWIKQLTPKEEYDKLVNDGVARMRAELRAEYGLTDGDSFDTPSIVGTASQD